MTQWSTTEVPRPAWRFVIAGAELVEPELADLTGADVTDETEGQDTANLQFQNPQQVYTKSGRFLRGMPVEIYAGPANGNIVQVFKGFISTISARGGNDGHYLTLSCTTVRPYGPAYRSTVVEAHTQTTVDEAVKRLLEPLGLVLKDATKSNVALRNKAIVSDFYPRGYETRLMAAQRLCSEYWGAELVVKGTTAFVRDLPTATKDPQVSTWLQWGQTPEMVSWDVETRLEERADRKVAITSNKKEQTHSSNSTDPNEPFNFSAMMAEVDTIVAGEGAESMETAIEDLEKAVNESAAQSYTQLAHSYSAGELADAEAQSGAVAATGGKEETELRVSLINFDPIISATWVQVTGNLGFEGRWYVAQTQHAYRDSYQQTLKLLAHKPKAKESSGGTGSKASSQDVPSFMKSHFE